MKKIFLPLALLFLAACSIEKDDLTESQFQFSELNAIVEIDGCEAESYNFENVGKIEVTNDAETLYITIASTADNFDLLNSKLHIANSPSGFPTVGQGNLPTVNMEYNKDFEPNVKSFTFEFPLADLEECIYIASHSTFSNGKKSTSSWVGDINVKHGNWSYFQYCIQECQVDEPPVCAEDVWVDLCPDLIYNPSNPSLQGFREYFNNQISLYTDLELSGTFSPTIEALRDQYLEEGIPITLKTNYTVMTEECGEITIEVAVDINEEHCD